jgi:zinc D-Ala-D-Ala carboxypeptidase
MNLSNHFSLTEFTKSQTAERKGIDNTPTQDHIDRIKILCVSVLEPLRTEFNKPIMINSGYRSVDLCEAIGSKSTSQHAKGEAADIEIPGVDNAELAKYIQDNLNFDQLILECYTGDPSSGWVHVSYVSLHTNRKDVLTYDRTNGYRKGLIV